MLKIEKQAKSAMEKMDMALKTDWAFIEKVLGDPHTRIVFLGGTTGTGKTYTAMRSGLGSRKLYCVTLTPETPAAELRGFWMPKGNEFVWQDGVFVSAMREGARVVVNEIAHASHDVLALMYPVLESEETAALTLPTGETVRPAKGFQVVCTDNVSIDYLPEALQDRFDSVLNVTSPHPAAIALLDPTYREAARRAFDLDEGRKVSIRGWIQVQKYAETMGSEEAFRACFGAERGHQLYTATLLIDEPKEIEDMCEDD